MVSPGGAPQSEVPQISHSGNLNPKAEKRLVDDTGLWSLRHQARRCRCAFPAERHTPKHICEDSAFFFCNFMIVGNGAIERYNLQSPSCVGRQCNEAPSSHPPSRHVSISNATWCRRPYGPCKGVRRERSNRGMNGARPDGFADS